MYHLILLFFILLNTSCQNEVQLNTKRPSPLESEATIQTKSPISIDFSQPTEQLTKLYLTKGLNSKDKKRLMEVIYSKPHAWLDSIYSFLNKANLNQNDSYEYCERLTNIKLSNKVMQTHQNDPFSIPEFPLWYHQVLSKFCREISSLEQKIDNVESDNRSIESTRKDLQSELDSANLVSIGAEIKRNDVAKGYWLLKGFLVNPGDSVYEISLPNLFEAQHLVCTSSTDCSAMKDLKAKIRGGFRDRVLLESMIRYNSKGRIEMLVVYDRTENLYTNSGKRVEWVVVKEASHYPLLNAQRNYLEAEQTRQNAQKAVDNLASPVDLSSAYNAKSKALETLSNGMNIYNDGKTQLPKYISNQDLYMKSKFSDLCDQLEWVGISSLKSKLTKSAYKKARKVYRKILKGVGRIECHIKTDKRISRQSFAGQLSLTTYKKNRKPKGSAKTQLYYISFVVEFDDRGEMTFSELDPQAQGEETIVEVAPILNRKTYAKRYKLHKPKLTLKKDYIVCNEGVDVFKRPRSKNSHSRLSNQAIVTKIDKARRGWSKVHLFNQRPVYIPSDQSCIKQTRQDGNFRTIFTPSHTITEINISEMPTKKSVTSQLTNTAIFISKNKMGEKKQWSSGWIMEGKNAGKRIYIKSVDLEDQNDQNDQTETKSLLP